MSNPAEGQADADGSQFLARLVALDETLADGGSVPVDPAADPRWRESAAVLELLHRSNPRRGSSVLGKFGAVSDLRPRPVGHPERVGRFVVEGIIGSGSSGVVYAATDPRFGRRVAVKVLNQSDDITFSRFRVEVTALAAVNHPHVVQVFELGEHEGRPFLVMEFVSGGALGNQAPGDDRPERNAARLVVRVARGVGAAHAAGIIHRDLKPGNILLTPDGWPKVADFGLARRLDRTDPLTEAGAAVGTPNYMSPEQAAGHGDEVGIASDVYGLGAILFSLLTGRPPFLGVIGFDLLRRIVNDAPPRPRSLNGSVPWALERICLRCLEKNPLDRYPSTEAVADDLEAFLSGNRFRAMLPTNRRGRRAVLGLIGFGGLALVLVGVLGRKQPTAPPFTADVPGPKVVGVRIGDVVGRHEGGIRALALSHDGLRAASFPLAGPGRVWDVAGRRVVAELPGTDRSATGVFFPDGDRVLAVFPQNRLGVWSVSQGRLVAERQLPENINIFAVRDDGELVGAADRRGITHLWRPATGEYHRSPAIRFNTGGAVGVAFRTGHDELLTALQHVEKLGVWKFPGDDIRVIPNIGFTMPNLLAALPDGRAVVSNGRRLLVITPTEPPQVQVLPLADGVGFRSLAVTNEGRWIACACHDGTTRVWDVESNLELARADTPGVRMLATTASGTRGVIAFADGTICELRLSGGE